MRQQVPTQYVQIPDVQQVQRYLCSRYLQLVSIPLQQSLFFALRHYFVRHVFTGIECNIQGCDALLVHLTMVSGSRHHVIPYPSQIHF